MALADRDFILAEEKENKEGGLYKASLHIAGNHYTDEQKIKIIEKQFAIIMETLGLDLNDDSLKDTPGRVAKMYVKEIFSGLNPANKPSISLFDNTYKYSEI